MSADRASSPLANVLTERQHVEATIYDARVRAVSAPADDDLRIDPNRPPLPNYEHEDFLTHALDVVGDLRGARVLEVGCGSGTIGVYLALRGADEVLGVDVSDEMIRLAERRALVNSVADRVQFRTVPVEAIDEPTGSFDRIVGNQVLHHFDLALAMPSIRRLLKPDGRASFCEPVLLIPEVFRDLRDSGLVTRLFPRRVDTPTERSLSRADIDLIRRELPGARVYPYQLLTRLQNFIGLNQTWFRRLSAIDRWLLRNVPPAQALCRFVVIEFTPTPGEQHVG